MIIYTHTYLKYIITLYIHPEYIPNNNNDDDNDKEWWFICGGRRDATQFSTFKEQKKHLKKFHYTSRKMEAIVADNKSLWVYLHILRHPHKNIFPSKPTKRH